MNLFPAGTTLPSDSWAWTHGLTVAPFETRIGVRANSSSLLREVRSCLLPDWCEVEGGEVDHLWSIFVSQDASFVHYGATDLRAGAHPLATFEQFFHLHVADTARGRTFVHAGVAVYGGRAIVLPGLSHAGKSTLTQALVEQGATFFSDDLAVLDGEGRVSPYPKPLSLRAPERTISAVQLGWRPGLASVPVGVVACLRFAQGATRGSWRRIPPARAVLGLVENCIAVRREPARDLACLGRVAEGAICFAGRRGEARETARALLACL